MAICDRIIDMSEPEKLDRYMRGLSSPEARFRILLEKPATFRAAAEIATLVDLAEAEFRRRDRGANRRRGRKPATSLGDSGGASSTGVAAVTGFRGRCYACDERSHRKTECPRAVTRWTSY
ncbi:hypothetical protein CLOM_g3049 [Closterium sp. NIES-68]|nr:hypothetical protein CLOM_g3049 [Closterium sp. NIES-68]